MRIAWKFGTLALVVGYFVACSPVKFDQVQEPACGGNGVSCVQKCSGDSCYQAYTIERTVEKKLVDILIVNDNSGSMSTEQKKMGSAFGSFLQSLDKLDFRIAMTTTDISTAFSQTPVGKKNWPGPYNGNGALQDGQLIDFGGGVKYLTSAAQDTMFRDTVSRPETEQCESSSYTQCPSDDERGIFAASLAIERNEFLRPNAHLALIFLADEDERGVTHQGNETGDERSLAQMYPLEERDMPQNLINLFKQKHPSKTLSAHSIVVKPGDQGCKSTQSSQGPYIKGREGHQYAKLSQLTGGIVGSICAGMFDTQLKDIGKNIQSRVLTLPFSCRPVGDAYTLTVTPHQAVTATADWTKLELTINQDLPPLTKITLSYRCETN